MDRTNNMRRRNIRRQLLVTVSAGALLACAYGAGEAQAGGYDSDRPQLWIELGGQLEGLNNPQEALSPSFMASITQANLLSALNVQHSPAYALTADGKITFQPDRSDWIFSASVRYGRSSANRHNHQQTPNARIPLNIVLPPPLKTAFPSQYHLKYGSYYPSQRVKLADGRSTRSERHFVLDFQAGTDVGLGMLSNHASSVLSVGVRIAQFTSKAKVHLSAVPDVQYPTAAISGTAFTAFVRLNEFTNAHIHFHEDTATANIQRNFRGIGPSVAWNASVPFAGDAERGEITLDWGANAAVLFGRQRTEGNHQTAVKSYSDNKWQRAGGNGCGNGDPCEKHGFFYNKTQHPTKEFGSYTNLPTAEHTNAVSINRTRSVTVPNVGGFAGLSFRYQDAKISFGYRADMFFGAIDGGIDTRKSENRGFFGPFASLSVGVGD